jgi:NAD(P)-dependent dehydrogenase (short-subunit alcohol dehydrogenase family)
MNAARRSAGPALLYCRLLEDKIAIVTWATSGVGAAAARAFAAAGATVVLAAPSEGDLEAIAAQVADRGGNALVVPVDLGDPVAAERLVHRTVEAFGRLDAAFNNTTRGIFLLMKHEIRAMLADGGGAIVNMTETAALNYRRHGIRVNAIAPGVSGPEEVAAAAVWLCSDQASFISGATIPVGGRRLEAALPRRA